MRWLLRSPVRVEGGWFFAYGIERQRSNGRPAPEFAYFPGFLVPDDGSVRDVDERGLRHLFKPAD
jgi:hypothetical protein